MFHGDIQTPRRELKIRLAAQRSIYDEIRAVWIANETLSLMFDISPRWKKKKLGVNGEVKSSKSMLIKIGYPNLCDFLCFILMNY